LIRWEGLRAVLGSKRTKGDFPMVKAITPYDGPILISFGDCRIPNRKEIRKMNDAMKEEAKKEIIRDRDRLLLERIHFYLVAYTANDRLKKIEAKLQKGKAAAEYFGIQMDYPAVKPDIFDFVHGRSDDFMWSAAKLKESMDSRSNNNWLPTGFATIEEVNTYVEDKLSQSNIDGNIIAQIEGVIKADTKATIAEISLELLLEAKESGMKAATIRSTIETELGRSIHEKSVGMTLYRLAQDEKVFRRGHIWFHSTVDPSKIEATDASGETTSSVALQPAEGGVFG
jgi:hypothetical protein